AITPNGRKFRTAIVDGKTSTLQTAYEVITDHAKIIASASHKFLNTKSSKWPTVGRMRLNNTSLSYVGSYNFNECSEFKSGYIQGLTEGDGTFRFDFSWKSVWRKESPQCYWRIAMTQMEALLRCKKYL